MGIDQGQNAEWTNALRSLTHEQATDLIVGYYSKLPLEWSDQYKAFFHRLLTPGSLPLVFHCTAGKDRTGIATALLLYILGVDMESNGKEYELSNIYKTDSHEKYIGLFLQHGIDRSIGSILMEVKREYLDRIFEAVRDVHDSMDNYIEGALGLNGDARAKLKEIFLE
jgi:protein-tyrosine phosphatase